jgi:primosomal protein N' (replication factor Y)
MRPSGAGATRTAEDLGRAFPGVRIVIADGERTVREVGAEPAIVIATRGAEPIAAGGYRAVLLLDGDRMVARASLRVGEDVLRWRTTHRSSWSASGVRSRRPW